MIEVRGLTKRYGDTVAVDDLIFALTPGRVTGFLGPHGAGKSTTMRMVLGLDHPTSGEALVDGRRYADLEQPLRVVGALLDARWVHPNRSARSHLRWVAASDDLPARRIDEVLELVGLTAVAGTAARRCWRWTPARSGAPSPGSPSCSPATPCSPSASVCCCARRRARSRCCSSGVLVELVLVGVVDGVAGTNIMAYVPFSNAGLFTTSGDLNLDGGADNPFGGPWGSLAYLLAVAAVLLVAGLVVARRRDAA